MELAEFHRGECLQGLMNILDGDSDEDFNYPNHRILVIGVKNSKQMNIILKMTRIFLIVREPVFTEPIRPKINQLIKGRIWNRPMYIPITMYSSFKPTEDE